MADGIDRFLKESSKSYKECSAKNSARRNSLMKKTLGMEADHRLAAADLRREERQLRQQLRQMQMEKERSATRSAHMRARSSSKLNPKTPKDQPATCPGADGEQPQLSPLDPYPVTFAQSKPTGSRSRSNTLDQPMRSRANTLGSQGKLYAARSGRRQSKEFEDLHLNTATGSLAVPLRLQLTGSWQSGGASPGGSPGTPSPYTPRRRLDSSSSMDSTGSAGHWVGDPEAIGSVRRARKSVEDQEKDRLLRTEARLQGHLHNNHDPGGN